ncbi:MAG TPA: hypothetical protein DCY13_21830, partial [Verrucomicrobiales bacterium]|nr:hypothetical protein [Verrucomicrobiales bacterium]
MKKIPPLRSILLAACLVLQLGPYCSRSASAPGDVDLSFDAGSGVNGPVTTFVQQPDGRMIIGGSFTTVRGLARRGIARLNADGSGDSSF